MIRPIYTPNYPVLMAADGPKCGVWGKGRSDRVPTRCVRPAGHVENHLQDVDPRFLRPDWNSPVATETIVLFRDENERPMALRGFGEVPTDTTLARFAGWLGASSWITLGELQGYASSTVVTEVDYAPDGSKLRTRTRPIGSGTVVTIEQSDDSTSFSLRAIEAEEEDTSGYEDDRGLNA